LYSLFRQLLRLNLRVFFKHIHFSNTKNIPYGKPIILAANHPGTFLDPILLACNLKKPIHFLVRGDIFKNRFIRSLLKQFRMIPIYRRDEGFDNLEKNHDSTDQVTEILKKNGIVLIFCEGYSSTHRRLRTILKGTARISMQTFIAGNVDVQIVPIGISYNAKTNFRKSVMFDFAPPILMADYKAEYEIHPQKSFGSITHELTSRLSNSFVMIRNESLDDITETHLNLFRNNQKIAWLPILIKNSNQLNAERQLCEEIEKLSNDESVKFDLLLQDTRAYQNSLIESGIKDEYLVSEISAFNLIYLVFLFPIFIIGFLIWGLPYIIARQIANKKVTRIDFYDSITLNITNILFFIISIIVLIMGEIILGWKGLLLIFAIPFICLLSAWYYDIVLKLLYSSYHTGKKTELLSLRSKVISR